MKYVFIVLGLIFLFVAIAWFYDRTISGGSFFNGNPAPGQRPLPIRDIVIASAAMLAGILFGAIYAQLSTAKEDVNGWSLIPVALSSPQLVKSLFASPIVFAVVYVAAQTQPDPVIGAFVAFQNGFFCDTVLRNRRESA